LLYALGLYEGLREGCSYCCYITLQFASASFKLDSLCASLKNNMHLFNVFFCTIYPNRPIVSKSVCSVNNSGDIFGTTYVIGINAVCFHGTLIKGEGV